VNLTDVEAIGKMYETDRHYLWSICTLVILIFALAGGCGKGPSDPAQRILGRWRVIDKEAISVPHSVFWAMMDFVEFRQEGVVWGLINWPPGGGSEIRLNVTGH
jgi:hypothetical protein